MDSGKARNHRDGGGVHFSEKSGRFRIFAQQIFWLPPAFGHPPHKCGGGKIVGSSTVPGVPQRHAFFVRKNGKDPGLMTSQLRAFPKRKER